MMKWSRNCALQRSALLLCALSLTACASNSRRLPPPPLEIPPPPAALMSPDSVTDWQTYSQKVESFFEKARKQVADLLSPPKDCSHTRPKSADCV